MLCIFVVVAVANSIKGAPTDASAVSCSIDILVLVQGYNYDQRGGKLLLQLGISTV